MIPNALPGVLALHSWDSTLDCVVANLEQGGYAVQTVETPDEAIAQLRRGHFGLFLGDVRLGGPSGLLLLAELRLLWPRTAAVILTSYALLEAST